MKSIRYVGAGCILVAVIGIGGAVGASAAVEVEHVALVGTETDQEPKSSPCATIDWVAYFGSMDNVPLGNQCVFNCTPWACPWPLQCQILGPDLTCACMWPNDPAAPLGSPKPGLAESVALLGELKASGTLTAGNLDLVAHVIRNDPALSGDQRHGQERFVRDYVAELFSETDLSAPAK